MAGHGYSLISAPTLEPLTIEEAMLQASVGRDEITNIDLLTRLVKVARAEAENRTGRALITQTWERTVDAFDTRIALDVTPVQSITSIKYDRASDGSEQTLAPTDYVLDAGSVRAFVIPAYGVSWPSTRDMPNAVRVRFVAGFGDASTSVPEDVRHWIAMRVTQLFAYREQVIAANNVAPNAFVDALLAPYVVHQL